MIRLMEPLEERRLMSTAPLAISLAGGVLTIDNAANIQVHEFVNTGGQVVVTSDNGLTNHGTFLGVTQIVINGTNGGDDVVSLDDADIRASISTFQGRDTIFVNNIAPTTITDPDLVIVDAGNGKDTIVATTDGTTGTITTIVLSKGTDSVVAPLV